MIHWTQPEAETHRFGKLEVAHQDATRRGTVRDRTIIKCDKASPALAKQLYPNGSRGDAIVEFVEDNTLS